jgi:hypothetical protein
MKKGEQISRIELREKAIVRQLLLTWLKNNRKMTANDAWLMLDAAGFSFERRLVDMKMYNISNAVGHVTRTTGEGADALYEWR